MTARVNLEFAGKLDHLRIAWETGEALLESVPFHDDPEGTRYNALLAIQEMVTNVLRHAFQLDCDQPVRLEFEVSDEAFSVTIIDGGPEFDPRSRLAKTEFVEDAMPTSPGGYGILIAKMVMDELEYERVDDKNILRMTKFVGVCANVATG